MSEEPEDKPPATTENDVLLEVFIKAAEATDGPAFGVTVTTNGTVITGVVTSVNAYLREVAERFDREGMSELAQVYRELISDETRPDDWKPRYLHLTRAQVFAGPGVIPTDVNAAIPWRVRLSDVDGWAIGSVGIS